MGRRLGAIHLRKLLSSADPTKAGKPASGSVGRPLGAWRAAPDRGCMGRGPRPLRGQAPRRMGGPMSIHAIGQGVGVFNSSRFNETAFH